MPVYNHLYLSPNGLDYIERIRFNSSLTLAFVAALESGYARVKLCMLFIPINAAITR